VSFSGNISGGSSLRVHFTPLDINIGGDATDQTTTPTFDVVFKNTGTDKQPYTGTGRVDLSLRLIYNGSFHSSSLGKGTFKRL